MNKGIYQIKNKINGKVYIGSTIRDLKGRWKVHKSLLKNNKHTNPHLQSAWNKYGEENFEFQIIELLFDNIEIIEKELMLINELKTYDREIGYNKMTSTCLNPMWNKKTRGMSGKKHSDESRLKIKERHADFSGDKNGRAKLTWEQVREIRKMYKNKISFKEIIKYFNIGQTTFYHIINNDTWRENND